jgi:hypothetical protein
MVVIGIGLFVYAPHLNLLLIAEIFAVGATVRGVMLLLVNDRGRLRQALPDLAISIIFLVLCVAIRVMSQFVAARHSPFLAVVACSLLLAPIAVAVGWTAIRRALDLAASLSGAPQPEPANSADGATPSMSV